MAKPSSSMVDLPPVQPVKVLRDIGAQIRAARRRQALRIDDAASLCGVSVDLLSSLENGKGSVGTDKVLRVAMSAIVRSPRSSVLRTASSLKAWQ